MLKRLAMSGACVLPLALAVLIGDGCKSNSGSTGPGGGGTGGVITVTGKVVGTNNVGVANVPVFATGRPSTNTDASGNFSIASVTTPYDITVVDAIHKSALVYKALTRSDPTLTFLGSVPGTAHTGVINGKISGGDFTPNQLAADVTHVAFASAEGNASGSTAVSGTFGPLNLSWYGPAVTTGTLYALQIQNSVAAPILPVTYKGYGVKSGIAVNDGSTLNNQFDTLQTVGTVQFTGTLTIPAGYTLGSKLLSARVSSVAAIGLLSDATTSTAMSYNTPSIPGATLVLSVITGTAGGGIAYAFKTGMSPNATGVAVNVPAAPGLSLPINGATGVDTTFTFSWTPYAGGVHIFFIQSSGNPTIYVLTTGTSTTIPNLKGLGLPLPASASYSWYVAGFAPFASADAAAGPGGFFSPLTSPAGPSADATIAESSPWTFTTAP